MKKNIQEIHALLSSPGPKIIHQDEDNRHPMIMPSPYIVPQQPPTIMVPASGRRRSSHLGPVVIHSPTPSITRSRSSSPSRTMVSEPGIFRRTFSRRTALTHRTDATGQELDSVISDFSSIVIIVSLFSLFFVKISFSWKWLVRIGNIPSFCFHRYACSCSCSSGQSTRSYNLNFENLTRHSPSIRLPLSILQPCSGHRCRRSSLLTITPTSPWPTSQRVQSCSSVGRKTAIVFCVAVLWSFGIDSGYCLFIWSVVELSFCHLADCSCFRCRFLRFFVSWKGWVDNQTKILIIISHCNYHSNQISIKFNDFSFPFRSDFYHSTLWPGVPCCPMQLGTTKYLCD